MAGVSIHTGASMEEYNAIFFFVSRTNYPQIIQTHGYSSRRLIDHVTHAQAGLGELAYSGTGVHVGTGCPAQEYFSLVYEGGQVRISSSGRICVDRPVV